MLLPGYGFRSLSILFWLISSSMRAVLLERSSGCQNLRMAYAEIEYF